MKRTFQEWIEGPHRGYAVRRLPATGSYKGKVEIAFPGKARGMSMVTRMFGTFGDAHWRMDLARTLRALRAGLRQEARCCVPRMTVTLPETARG